MQLCMHVNQVNFQFIKLSSDKYPFFNFLRIIQLFSNVPWSVTSVK